MHFTQILLLVCNSGVIINTGPIFNFQDYCKSIKNMVNTFGVDLIIVIDHGGLYSLLANDIGNKKVLKFHKLSDVRINLNYILYFIY